MAFLSSFRIGQQTVYPEELHERLKRFALLENVGDAALRNLLAEANWFALPGGTLLDRDGENNAALFLVVNRLANDQPLEIHGRHHILCPIKPDLVLTNQKPSDNTRAWSGSDPIAR